VTRAFLSLGSNLGDRRKFLAEAVTSLGPMVRAVSPLYETAPVGGPDQGAFLNLVVELETDLPPRELLSVCHRLESGAGRVRLQRWGPRTLDVDILWIDGVTVDEPDLQVPHPRMFDRRFVLVPLRDLAPELVPADAFDRADGVVAPVEPLAGWEPTGSDSTGGSAEGSGSGADGGRSSGSGLRPEDR
jgi:2-amino-4-hydroxy-6-hydroxymethyldihydropteridine diphosphokinase